MKFLLHILFLLTLTDDSIEPGQDNPGRVRQSEDIVQAHGGELKVEAKEGEGSEFIIQL